MNEGILLSETQVLQLMLRIWSCYAPYSKVKGTPQGCNPVTDTFTNMYLKNLEPFGIEWPRSIDKVMVKYTDKHGFLDRDTKVKILMEAIELSTTTVTVKISQATKYAKDKLNSINKFRLEQIEVIIKQKEKQKKWKFPFKFVPRYNSREEIMAEIENGDYMFSDYAIIMATYGKQEQLCKRIIKLSKMRHPDDLITLSLEDFDNLTY